MLITGLQGLVRLPLDQHRADRRRGLHTGTMISGYQGSPLGGLDQELSATASWPRSTTSTTCPGSTRSSAPPRPGAASWPPACPARATTACSRIWYGKAPGLDRAADSLRHGNFVGVSRTRRRAGRRGRRSELQVLHDPQRLRADAGQPAHAGLLPRQRPGGSRPRPARARLLARVRPLGRLQDRHERGRRRQHRRRRAGPRQPRDAGGDLERAPLRARAQRQPARPGVARDGAHAARPAHGAGARLRARERHQPHRGRPRRLARRGGAGQVLLRPDARPAWARARRAGARARRHPDSQAGHGLAARAARSPASSLPASTRSSWPRRRARSWRRCSRTRSTGWPAHRACSASATSRAMPLLPADARPRRRPDRPRRGGSPAGARAPARLGRGPAAQAR